MTLSSDNCSIGRHGYAIGYSFISSIFTLTIIYLLIKLIIEYRRNDILNRPPKWLFYTGLIFILITIIILIKCIIYGLSHCQYIIIAESRQEIIFNVIFRDLYVIQLYFLWIVLFIRLYYIFNSTGYRLSKLTIRIYSSIFIFSPILTVLLSVNSLYTIFIVLGLSGGIFITLSIIILYIFKLIQVYTRYTEYQEHQNIDNDDNIESSKQNNLGLLTTITKNTILVIISTLFSLLILFILIMNFIFTVYKIKYGYQQEFLDICLLLDVYITTLCLIFQYKYLHSSYEYFCGCIDIVCRYYCNQFVNPSNLLYNNHSLQPISATNPSQLPRVSIELRPPNYHNGAIIVGNGNKNNNLSVPLNEKNIVVSESEQSPQQQRYNNNNNNDQFILNTPVIDDPLMSEDERQESATYDMGKNMQMQLEDLPSLPMAESRDKATNDIRKIIEQNANKLYIVGGMKMDEKYNKNKQKKDKDIHIISPSKTRSRSGTATITQTPIISQMRDNNGVNHVQRLAVPSYSSKQNSPSGGNNQYGKNNNYLNNYHGIALEQIEQKELPELNMNRDSNRIHEVLTRNGFKKKYTKRALAVYEVTLLINI